MTFAKYFLLFSVHTCTPPGFTVSPLSNVRAGHSKRETCSYFAGQSPSTYFPKNSFPGTKRRQTRLLQQGKVLGESSPTRFAAEQLAEGSSRSWRFISKNNLDFCACQRSRLLWFPQEIYTACRVLRLRVISRFRGHSSLGGAWYERL